MSGIPEPFCWISLAALEKLRVLDPHCRKAAQLLYLSLAEMAAAAYDGFHEGFEATGGDVERHACLSHDTTRKAREALVALGLLRVEGRGNRRRWILLPVTNGSSPRQRTDRHPAPRLSEEEAQEALWAEAQRDARPPTRKRSRGGVCYDGDPVPPGLVRDAECVLRTFNETLERNLGAYTARGGPSRALTQIIGAMLAHPEASAEQWKTAVRNTAANPPDWLRGKPLTIGAVFGPNAAEHALVNDGVVRMRNGNGRRDADPEKLEKMRAMRMQVEAVYATGGAG